MSRPSLLVLAASVAAIAVGCAHCDTCDDFPAPCTGPNCGHPYQVTLPMGGDMVVEPIVGGPIGMPAGQIVNGPVVSGPVGASPAPAPPAAPAGGATSGPGASTPPASGSDSPPPADEPADIPLPPAASPFGGPLPN